MRSLQPLLFAAVLLAVSTGPVAAAVTGSAPNAPPSDRVHWALVSGKAIPIGDLGNRQITIDGDLSDWGSLIDGGTAISEQTDIISDESPGDRTNAAVFKLLRGSDSLYIAVAVADPSRSVSGPGTPYLGDAVELFFDVRPVASSEGPKLGDSKYTDGGVYQLIFTAPQDGDTSVTWKQFTGVGKPFGPAEVAARNYPWGYTMEMRVPYSSIAGATADRFKDPFGFDIYIDDRDVDKGLAVYSWGGKLNDWLQSDNFGVVIPGYHSDLPAPYLRTISARYTPPPVAEIAAAEFTPLKADMRSDPVEMNMRRMGLPGSSNLVGSVMNSTIDYPTLGFSLHLQKAAIKDLAYGRYNLQSRFNDIPDSVTSSSIETLTWRHQPTAEQIADSRVGTRADTRSDNRFVLPNGWTITPVGKQIPLAGDMPMRLVFSRDGKTLYVNTAGFNQHGISAIDVATSRVVDNLDLHHIWYGMDLAASGDRIIVSGGGVGESDDPAAKVKDCKRALVQVSLTGGKMIEGDPITLPGGDGEYSYAAGVLCTKDGSVYVVDLQEDTVYKLSGDPLAVVASNKVYYRPYALAISPDGKTLAVTDWGAECVSFLDPQTLKVKGSVPVGSHPNDIAYASDGRLFVSNGGSNSVSVYQDGSIIETIATSLDPHAPVGSTPDALAVSPDGKRLYVANADNNDVAVVDISSHDESQVIGFIPTGWYPSALAVSPDGTKIYVGVGKGLHFTNSAGGQYIGNLLNGAVSVISSPTNVQLAKYTRMVVANTPLPRLAPSTAAQKAIVDGAFHKIKHVVYIIRENRTYDQVLGDMDKGDGMPSITMFGKEVTPNAHTIADHYVLLDNLYCNGEVSEDGHQWCNAAYATDFKERAWPGSYSGRGEPDADDRLQASPAGYLWDNCARHGVSYISYGEFAGYDASPTSPPAYHGVAALAGHTSKEFSKYRWMQDHDTKFAQVFIDDLHRAEKTGNWPGYMVMWLGEDHTAGLSAGQYTPIAAVAANDQAIGMVVEAVSRSRFWKDTAIFIIEDDAQDGPDHVDAHRTVGLVVSPYVKRNTVDSTFYTTSSFVHTMEMMLNIPTMTQYDSAAEPLYNAFTTTPDFSPYKRVEPLVNLYARNGSSGQGALLSAKLDFSAPDRADPQVLNHILWSALKPGLPMPAPVRSAHLGQQVAGN